MLSKSTREDNRQIHLAQIHKYTSGAPGRGGLVGLKYNGQLSDGSANVGPQASDWGGVGLIHARTAKKISNQKHTHTETRKGNSKF